MAISGMRWGDEEDDLLPQRVESEPDSNGVRQIVEWKLNDAGDKVKVTKKVKKVTEVERVSKRALERKKWAKFGDALDDGDGSNVTYMSYEEVTLEDPNADQILPGEKKEEENIFAGVKNSSIVVCRHCGMVGDHWTLKCPYKDTPKEELEQDMAKRAEAGESAAPAAAPAEPAARGSALDGAFGSSKYVPPSLRGRAGAGGDAGGDNSRDSRDDSCTLRVTNVSPDTREDDLKELFRAFGPVARVYLAKDRETFQSRGFAFVSFMYREDAEKAMAKLQGYGYDHLILKLEWAKPSNKPAQEDAGSMGTTFRSGYGKALPQNVAPPPRK
ncbi:Eukaryotic translation initiation factor 3 subunit G [Phytophthora megakarya]|uniref:Eukaryotic translation initiation factor 3 subunit G n=1 Tax=Phytophthora megakarya TaxID=4795 RepID=A0A225WGP2_9STRA|nr:Eukaryotic translation initiation factor 3 subunit G [Phytophthora megakarya]